MNSKSLVVSDYFRPSVWYVWGYTKGASNTLFYWWGGINRHLLVPSVQILRLRMEGVGPRNLRWNTETKRDQKKNLKIISCWLLVVVYRLLVIGCCWLVIEADLSIQQVQTRTFLFFKFTRAALECPFFLSRLFSSWKLDLKMGVSKNRGTPKSSILIGFSIINHPPLFLETPKSRLFHLPCFSMGSEGFWERGIFLVVLIKMGCLQKLIYSLLSNGVWWRVTRDHFAFITCLRHGMYHCFEKTTRLFGSVSTHLSAPHARTKSRVGSSDSCLILFKAGQAGYPP